jgi:hypothetical protein
MVTLFQRLEKRRPPASPTQPQNKFAANQLTLELQKLHDWLQRQDQPTILLRDIRYRGPRFMRRGDEKALYLLETLTRHGWLIPLKSRRSDQKEWEIVKEPGGYRKRA